MKEMKTIRCAEYGIVPGKDITEALYRLFCENPRDTEFIFEPGNYDFSPCFAYDYRLSNSDVLPERKLGIWLKNMEHVRVDFSGSHLYFIGQMQPITLDHCTDVTLENAVIDWKKPLVAEGIVKGVGEGYVDLYIDPDAFPHKYENNWISFDTGNGEWYPWSSYSAIQYNGDSHTVQRNTGDCFAPIAIADLGGNTYRVTANAWASAKVGNIFVLRHNERVHAGAFIEKCDNVTLTNITFHSCGGLGCLAQFSHDLTFRGVHFLPNTEAGRRISGGRDDGMHITCNSGTVTIEDCSFVGLMDDPINVHSCCVTVTKVLDDHTLLCHYEHNQALGFHYWAEAGDKINFIERRHMSSVGTATAAAYTLGESRDLFVLSFDAPLPAALLEMAGTEAALSLDNLSHTAAFVCRNNRFGSCRARGILVSTPQPVRIQNNYFASSGAAILVAGDSNYWFESGECHDVEISGNVFTDVCLSSAYQFGEGIISICPVVPEPVTALPYHKNIRVFDNIFDTAQTPVLYAFSAGDLTFENNRIYCSPTHIDVGAESWLHRGGLIRLEHVCGAAVRNNTVTGPLALETYEIVASENLTLD